MSFTLPSSLLSRLGDFVAKQTGLHFPQKRWSDLDRRITAAALDFGFPDGESCARWLLGAPPTRSMNEVLASHLSVGETYFFRDKGSLEILREQVLPHLLQLRCHDRCLRIWSAGCSTGEEAYTLAILLDRLIPDPANWNITILATDFNLEFLHKAAQGVYGEWSFRDAPGWLRERYFIRGQEGCFEILPRIRKMVTFSYLNLADEVYPSLSTDAGAMDLIFCRNVLMYFTPRHARQVVGNFHRALMESGWLVVSPAEASSTLFSSFVPAEFPGGEALYRKMADTASQMQFDRDTILHLSGEVEAVPSIPQVTSAETKSSLLTNATMPDEIFSAVQARQADELGIPLRMARRCANQGKLGEAREWCEQTIAADKLNPAHYYLLATILQEQGRYDTAIHSLMRALYLDPDFLFAHFALGNIYQSQRCYRQAQRHFRNVLALLRQHPQDESLSEADGLTAGRLAEIVTALLENLPPAVVAASE